MAQSSRAGVGVHTLTAAFPKQETYSLSLQMRRAAVSVPANIGCIDHICRCLAHGFRIETVDHRLKAVNYYHRQSGLPEPANKEVRAFLYKARRAMCEKPQGMRALTPDLLR